MGRSALTSDWRSIRWKPPLFGFYSVARTLVDLFSYRNKIGLDVALEALREGWKSRKFTLAEINRIAGFCRMRRVMQPYLESLAS